MRVLPMVLIIVGCLPALGCAGSQARPTIASSVGQPVHAMAYPEHVAEALSRMQQDEERARQQMSEFAEYPEQLKAPDWRVVQEILLLADEEGRGQSFASATARTQTVRRFFEERDRELGRRIVGSVNLATQDKGCSEDVGPAAFHSTKRTVAKQLTEVSRDSNAAQHAVTDHQTEVGKRNLKALRLQVEAISLVSHTAHVGLDDHRWELERMASELGEAERTLLRAADDLQLRLNDGEHDGAAKKGLEKRLAAVRESQGMLGEQGQALQQAAEEARARVDALRADYAAAFAGLQEALQRAGELAASE